VTTETSSPEPKTRDRPRGHTLLPVVVHVRASLDLADGRIAADGAPDLRLELARCNIIADIVVVCLVSERDVQP
jgi:hypothetical protein